jgi:ACS family hexuronate transporter-like MFS transporter
MIKNNFRWVLIFIGFIGVTICYIDRSAISYAITPLQHQLHLNNNDFGLITSVFGFGYFLMMFISGLIVDKFGSHYTWGIAAFIWSIITLLLGFSNSLITLITCRFLLGMSEAPTFPSMTKSITNWLSSDERSRAFAINLAAVPFASIIGAPICTLLINKFSWQVMFIILAIAGIIWSIIWVVFASNKPDKSKYVTDRELQFIIKNNPIYNKNKDIQQISITKILFNKTLLINNYAFFAFGYLLFFAISWLPGYLEQSFHIKLNKIGLFLILPWTLATIFMITVGIISDKIWQKTHSIFLSRSILISISLILSAGIFIFVIQTTNLYLNLILLSLALATGLSTNGCYSAINADLTPKQVATSLAIMNSFLALSGILAPLITGYLSNITHNFNMSLYIMVFLNFSAGILILIFPNPDKALRLSTD